ncbi:MAG: aspartate/glutamate racemase family protein [Rhizobiaceae bacterium]|nr:aspartate/glutamate racemase family protein [Rhizobiaceae bacterium]
MRTIGLIGGMSWESSAVYYRLINEGVRDRLGALHSAKLLLWSAEFSEIAAHQTSGDWDRLGRTLADAAVDLERAGVDVLLICSNTMHKVAAQVAQSVSAPLINIVHVTADAITRAGYRRPLLLATAFTMNDPFYRDLMEDQGDIDVMLPDEDERRVIHRIIYDELCQGIITSESKQRCMEIVRRGQERGADSVIFGCTEIGLLVSQSDFALTVFDTTRLHAQAAVDYALASPLAGIE